MQVYRHANAAVKVSTLALSLTIYVSVPANICSPLIMMASLTQYPYTRPPPQPAHVDTTRRLGAVAILGRRSVPELQELVALRSKVRSKWQVSSNTYYLHGLNVLWQGWDDDHLDYYFKTLRKISDSPSKQAKQTWFKNMRNIMAELNSAANFVRSSTNMRFLDVG